MSSHVVQITDKSEHDDIVAKSKDTATVIYVSNSSLPVCKTYTPKYEELASKWEENGIKFYQLEFTSKTSMMFKFSPNQLPVTVLMVHDRWCKTVMGANPQDLEHALEQLAQEAMKPDPSQEWLTLS